MDVGALLPIDSSSTDVDTRWVFALFVVLPTALGAVHHIDHMIRGNHIGWPLTSDINAFTFSLSIYPIIAGSLILTASDRVGSRYWAWLFALSATMLAFVHVSPWAVEPPGAVIGPYENAVVGYLAFGVLLALIGAVLGGCAFAVGLWRRENQRG